MKRKTEKRTDGSEMMFVFMKAVAVIAVFMLSGALLGHTEIFAGIGTAVAGIAMVFMMKNRGIDIKKSIRPEKFEIKTIVYMTILIFSVSELLKFASGMIFSNFTSIEPQYPAEFGVGKCCFLLLIAPVFEEHLFRFGVGDLFRFKRGMNKGILFTVIATSICDTIYHGPDIQQLPAVFFTAAMLSIVYIFTENINHTVFIHLLLNVLKFIPFGTYSFVNGFSVANVSHVIACTVLAVIGAVYFFGYFRPRFITRTYVPEFEIVSADE